LPTETPICIPSKGLIALSIRADDTIAAGTCSFRANYKLVYLRGLEVPQRDFEDLPDLE